MPTPDLDPLGHSRSQNLPRRRSKTSSSGTDVGKPGKRPRLAILAYRQINRLAQPQPCLAMGDSVENYKDVRISDIGDDDNDDDDV